MMFVSFHYFLLYFLHLVAQSCPTLCDPMACSPPGSSVLGDSPGKNTGVGFHALLCGSSQARDQTQISHVAGEFFTVQVTKEVHEYWSGSSIPSPGDLPDPGIKPRFPALQADSLPAELSGKSVILPRPHLFDKGSSKLFNWSLPRNILYHVKVKMAHSV